MEALRKDLIETIYQDLLKVSKEKQHTVILALDGRCAAGKTTFAAEFSKAHPVPVFHMDHFFLRPEQRTPERYAEPGGNIDRERFLEEVLIPLKEGKPFRYRTFRCHDFTFGEPISVTPGTIALVEGSYSLHPALREFYDRKMFFSVDPKEQEHRIIKRNGAEALLTFQSRWIPMEENYFTACRVQECCDWIMKTDEGQQQMEFCNTSVL